MPCYFPLYAIRQSNVSNSKLTINKRYMYDKIPSGYEKLIIPCGQCIGCRLEKSRQWAIRMQNEASMYESNCFVTLTYDNDHLPFEKGKMVLDKTHLQNFMKYLRRDFGDGIRFYGAGEYGEQCHVCHYSRLQCTCKKFTSDFGRPHYHACIFNHHFTDLEPLDVSSSGFPYFTSDALNKLWPKGRATVQEFTFETAAYTARYVTKKQTGRKAPFFYKDRPPEFALMSRRPGIGKPFYDKYVDSIYQNDMIVIRENLKCTPPKYYDSLYNQSAPLDMEYLKNRRVQKALLKEKHNTPERMSVRNRLQELKNRRLLRSLENG